MHPLDRVDCVLGDLTTMAVDAIVNAANATLRGGGGVDGAIHRAAGPGLLAECVRRYPDGCPTGAARHTNGHDLPARHVIHVVGPVWDGGAAGEADLLASCYLGALAAARGLGLRTIAFPAVSCGVYGYPHDLAAAVAIGALARGLAVQPGIERASMVLFTEPLRAAFAAELALQRGR